MTEVYNIGQKMVIKVGELDTSDAYQFLETLEFDQNGNLVGQLKVKENTHTIRLSHHSKPSRGKQREDQLRNTKEKLTKLKTTIFHNIIENIIDQNSQESWYYNWSGFDLTLPLSLSDRIDRMREINRLYTTEQIHTKLKYVDAKDEKTAPDLWKVMQLNCTIHQPLIVLKASSR